nr:hypothetical protein [uncultured Prevotella sp.]
MSFLTIRACCYWLIGLQGVLLWASGYRVCCYGLQGIGCAAMGFRVSGVLLWVYWASGVLLWASGLSAAPKRFVSMRSHTANRSSAAGETSDGPPTIE